MKPETVDEFVDEYDTTESKHRSERLMDAIKRGMPAVYEQLDDDWEYSDEELEQIIDENL